ncbi:MAG TPA: hypothetical protein VG815_07960 [Chloroflexota bacterium]|nr:hypothetical protein [Chloroflexota bacterium]
MVLDSHSAYIDKSTYDEWLNSLMENAPEEIDGDVAMEELVLQYIHWLEDRVPGVNTRVRNAKCMGCPDHV